MRRFKIIDPSGRTRNLSYDTLKEVVEDLQGPNRDLGLQTYYVECSVDDIEIEADELLSAWKEGEMHQDLQMF